MFRKSSTSLRNFAVGLVFGQVICFVIMKVPSFLPMWLELSRPEVEWSRILVSVSATAVRIPGDRSWDTVFLTFFFRKPLPKTWTMQSINNNFTSVAMLKMLRVTAFYGSDGICYSDLLLVAGYWSVSLQYDAHLSFCFWPLSAIWRPWQGHQSEKCIKLWLGSDKLDWVPTMHTRCNMIHPYSSYGIPMH